MSLLHALELDSVPKSPARSESNQPENALHSLGPLANRSGIRYRLHPAKLIYEFRFSFIVCKSLSEEKTVKKTYLSSAEKLENSLEYCGDNDCQEDL